MNPLTSTTKSLFEIADPRRSPSLRPATLGYSSCLRLATVCFYHFCGGRLTSSSELEEEYSSSSFARASASFWSSSICFILASSFSNSTLYSYSTSCALITGASLSSCSYYSSLFSGGASSLTVFVRFRFFLTSGIVLSFVYSVNCFAFSCSKSVKKFFGTSSTSVMFPALTTVFRAWSSKPIRSCSLIET